MREIICKDENIKKDSPRYAKSADRVSCQFFSPLTLEVELKGQKGVIVTRPTFPGRANVLLTSGIELSIDYEFNFNRSSF